MYFSFTEEFDLALNLPLTSSSPLSFFFPNSLIIFPYFRRPPRPNAPFPPPSPTHPHPALLHLDTFIYSFTLRYVVKFTSSVVCIARRDST